MPYVVEVDQSIKVEDPGDTFLAFSDGISYVIKVSFNVKQKGFQALQNRGKPKKRAKLLLFAACVFLLLENHLEQLQRVTVDNEYDGRQADIKSFLLEYIRKKHPSFEAERIEIRAIGKRSPADHLAGAVRRGKREADRVITVGELLAVVGRKKIGGSLSLWDLMPSYNPGLVTGGVTRPPDLSKNIAHKLTFVKSSLIRSSSNKKGPGFPCGLKAKELRD